MENELLFKKLYLQLFNSVTDALELIEGGDAEGAADILRQAQINCEERYIEDGGED